MDILTCPPSQRYMHANKTQFSHFGSLNKVLELLIFFVPMLMLHSGAYLEYVDARKAWHWFNTPDHGSSPHGRLTHFGLVRPLILLGIRMILPFFFRQSSRTVPGRVTLWIHCVIWNHMTPCSLFLLVLREKVWSHNMGITASTY